MRLTEPRGGPVTLSGLGLDGGMQPVEKFAMLGACPSNPMKPRILKQMETNVPNFSKDHACDGRSQFFCFVPRIIRTGS
jgi:hypothetical protein